MILNAKVPMSAPGTKLTTGLGTCNSFVPLAIAENDRSNRGAYMGHMSIINVPNMNIKRTG